MKKHWIVVAATAGIVAAGTWAFAFTSGPSVSTGSNPLKTLTAQFSFTYVDSSYYQVTKDVYEVPPGQTLVITDFANSTTPINPGLAKGMASETNSSCAASQLCIFADGLPQVCASDGQPRPFNTGIAIPSGTKVALYARAAVIAPNAGSYSGKCNFVLLATGYLMKN